MLLGQIASTLKSSKFREMEKLRFFRRVRTTLINILKKDMAKSTYLSQQGERIGITTIITFSF